MKVVFLKIYLKKKKIISLSLNQATLILAHMLKRFLKIQVKIIFWIILKILIQE